MKNAKATQRDNLIREFGILVSPWEQLARATSPPNPSSFQIATAKVQGGRQHWNQLVTAFTTFAADLEFQQAAIKLHMIVDLLRKKTYTADELGHHQFRKDYQGVIDAFFHALNLVPVEFEPEVFPANSPFSSYFKIKTTIAVVNKRFHYFDRYLKPDFFQLFVHLLPRGVEVRLITTAGQATGNAYGVAGVKAISDLAKKEFTDYRLIQVDPMNLHDRNMIVDDQVFSLGPGVDQAGIALTNFGPSDNSPAALGHFASIISGGVVV